MSKKWESYRGVDESCGEYELIQVELTAIEHGTDKLTICVTWNGLIGMQSEEFCCDAGHSISRDGVFETAMTRKGGKRMFLQSFE